ncbi:MAG: YceI family protein [Bdellovibrionaceae bacterium]|nr:YceI family protein [Pseudobdellovibrionaceae bacterium]
MVKLKLSPAGQFDAKTKTIEGKVTVKNNEVSAQNIKVPLNTLETGIKLRDEHMKDKYLDVKKYPYATLKVGKGVDGKGDGEIEIRGITKKIQGTYKIEKNILEAEFPLKLSDFEIKGIRYMGVGVKDEVRVIVKMPIN